MTRARKRLILLKIAARALWGALTGLSLLDRELDYNAVVEALVRLFGGARAYWERVLYEGMIGTTMLDWAAWSETVAGGYNVSGDVVRLMLQKARGDEELVRRALNLYQAAPAQGDPIMVLEGLIALREFGDKLDRTLPKPSGPAPVITLGTSAAVKRRRKATSQTSKGVNNGA